eukprot:2248785-Pyramimonas_sp.AAC.1
MHHPRCTSRFTFRNTLWRYVRGCVEGGLTCLGIPPALSAEPRLILRWEGRKRWVQATNVVASVTAVPEVVAADEHGVCWSGLLAHFASHVCECRVSNVLGLTQRIRSLMFATAAWMDGASDVLSSQYFLSRLAVLLRGAYVRSSRLPRHRPWVAWWVGRA